MDGWMDGCDGSDINYSDFESLNNKKSEKKLIISMGHKWKFIIIFFLYIQINTGKVNKENQQ